MFFHEDFTCSKCHRNNNLKYMNKKQLSAYKLLEEIYNQHVS